MCARALRATVATLVIVALTAPAPLAAREQARVRVGGEVERPRLVRRVNPVYPPDAKADGVEGLVILEVTVGTDGKVVGVDVVRRVDPRLDEAAAHAVRLWEYAPTTHHGEPVEVVMTVNVTFALERGRPTEG